ncbi:UNVERIFIED_CONTAM: hypothetical protein FKN15_075644 [Acipenser sinensis]
MCCCCCWEGRVSTGSIVSPCWLHHRASLKQENELVTCKNNGGESQTRVLLHRM